MGRNNPIHCYRLGAERLESCPAKKGLGVNSRSQPGTLRSVECVQSRPMELMNGLEHKSYKEQLRKLGVQSLEERRFRSDRITLLQLPERRL